MAIGHPSLAGSLLNPILKSFFGLSKTSQMVPLRKMIIIGWDNNVISPIWSFWFWSIIIMYLHIKISKLEMFISEKSFLWSLVKLLGAHKVHLHIYNQLLYQKKIGVGVQIRLSHLEFLFKFFFLEKAGWFSFEVWNYSEKCTTFQFFLTIFNFYVESTKSVSDGWFTCCFWMV